MILFIDDNHMKRYVCCAALRRAGHAVIETTTFEQALQVLVSAKPRLVVSDAHLAEHTGYELCRRIKKTLPVPVILVSTRPPDDEEMKSSGVDAYLENFENGEKLVEIVSRLITRNTPVTA